MYNELQFIKGIVIKWKDEVLEFIPRLFLAIIVLSLFYYIAKLLRKLSLKFYGTLFKNHPDVIKIISTSIYVLFLVFGFFLVLEILGLEGIIAKILAGAGILGIIAGFAFKDIASNAFAGFLLNMQNPFVHGDWVKIDSCFGTINNIGLITTSIKTVSGEEVFVPNQLIYNHSFVNYSSYKKRCIILKSGVSYSDDLEKVKIITIDEIEKMNLLLPNGKIDFFYTTIGAYSYNFELRFWIYFDNQIDYLNAKSEAIIRIKKRFEKEGISIPYPIQSLELDMRNEINTKIKSTNY